MLERKYIIIFLYDECIWCVFGACCNWEGEMYSIAIVGFEKMMRVMRRFVNYCGSCGNCSSV